jgi:hypothetical protein
MMEFGICCFGIWVVYHFEKVSSRILRDNDTTNLSFCSFRCGSVAPREIQTETLPEFEICYFRFTTLYLQ